MRNKKKFFIGFTVLAILISICVWYVWFRSSGNIDDGDLSTCMKKFDKEFEAIKGQGPEKVQQYLKGVLDAKNTGNNRFMLALALFGMSQEGPKLPDRYIQRAKQIADKGSNLLACWLLEEYYRGEPLSAKYRTRAKQLDPYSQAKKECERWILKWKQFFQRDRYIEGTAPDDDGMPQGQAPDFVAEDEEDLSPVPSEIENVDSLKGSDKKE